MKRTKRLPWATLAVPLLALLAACGGASDPTAPSAIPTSSASPGASASSDLSAAALAAMGELIQDEYHAEAVYTRVVLDLGNVRPFSNIVEAERQHALSIARLYEARGLAVPASAWTPDAVAGFATLSAACAAGAAAELANLALYDAALALELPADARVAFEANRRASIENHYPAFQRCQ
jgi:hypothetical protein